MGLAHPDLVFRIQDSIITERKTLKPKKYLKTPKKTPKLVCIIFTCNWSTICTRTSEAE